MTPPPRLVSSRAAEQVCAEPPRARRFAIQFSSIGFIIILMPDIDDAFSADAYAYISSSLVLPTACFRSMMKAVVIDAVEACKLCFRRSYDIPHGRIIHATSALHTQAARPAFAPCGCARALGQIG